MNQASYRNLISGSNDGFLRNVLRALLRAISRIYRLTIGVRNFFYDKGYLRAHRVESPVISVGNITTGGTGKTPLVIWLCRYLESKALSCAILTRGYKPGHNKLADEPVILAKSCPEVKVIINSDRVAAARKAFESFHPDVMVMDDGFQHRRLHRDLNIIAIDATCPFGYGHLLPAGLLREPAESIKRSHVVVITHYDQASTENIAELEKKILQIKPNIVIAKAAHQHPYAMAMKDQEISLEKLKESKIFVFCGVGNPNAFLNRLEEFNLNIKGSKIYNDHHEYTKKDISDIYEQAKELEVDLILSTQKDWVKTALLLSRNENIIFAYLALELEFIEGVGKIEALVDKTIKSFG